MIVKYISESLIETSDIDFYKEKTSKLKGFVFNANDIDLNKRIISVRVIGDDDLILVNPKIVNTSNNSIVYYEKDTYKSNKVRKTVRFSSIIVETDNLGMVEFKPTNEKPKWESYKDFMEDAGLLECVLVQRAIDAINGIDITHKSRAYTETITAPKKPNRNDRVMLQSPNGETVFIKYKNSDEYIKKGYSLV